MCLALVIGAGCSGANAQSARSTADATAKRTGADEANARRQRRTRLAAAKSWGYQLRIRDLAPLYAASPDVLVVDHGLAARRDGKLLFEASEIERLKVRVDGRRRIVLSYLSIGEAEQYRFYWQADWCRRATAPAWIGAVNPNWPGNYPVRFWDPAWQNLILDGPDSYLAKIQAQGFDGIYLDRADVWSEWTKERPGAEREMVAFLGRIAVAARVRDPGFLVVMQNAEELLVHRAVRRALDGVAKEDLLYGVNFTEAANDGETVASAVGNLKRARADGLPVFAVEYLADPALVRTAQKRLASYGFVATFAPRLLDSLWPVEDGAVVAPPSVPAPPVGVAPLPGPSWGEGGASCLVD